MARMGTRSGAAVALLAIGALTVLPLPRPAWAVPMHVMESHPSAQTVMDGKQTEFFIRFDHPVDHAASVLTLLRDGHVVQVLHPRLNSQPNTLYAGVGGLAEGAYVLRWTTRSMPDHEAVEGDIPFSVKPH